MADKKTGAQPSEQAQNQDPSFIYGDAPPKTKIDPWEGEGEADLVSDSGEMALANLHFGTTQDADMLRPGSSKTEADNNDGETGKPVEPAPITVVTEEHAEGAVIANLGATAVSDDGATDYAVSDDRFEIVDGHLQLADGLSLDFETTPSVDVTVTATRADGSTVTETFLIEIIDINDPPSDLMFDGTSVSENDAGAVIGTLSSFDPDAGDTVTYTVSDGRFEVVDGVLRLVDGVSLDHEAAASIELTVTATDSGGLSTEETFTIDVLDVNEGPSDLTLDNTTVAENDAGAVVGTLSSFDPDDGDSVTYTVSDDRFEVIDGQVRLVDGVSLDHEDAASIDLTITATDSGGLSTEETFTIDVIDVNEGPSDLALDGSSVSENDAGAVVGTLSSFDPDAGDSVTYTVSDDRFEVVDGVVRLVDGVSLDHEEAASIELTVTATDSGGLSTEETFTIDVIDVNEGPRDLSLDGSSVSENDAGAVVGTLSSFDPDAGDSVTYTVSDDRFEVVDGVVQLVDGVSLDHEDAASIELTITATDSGGLSTEETFTIDVLDVNEGPSDLTLDNTTVAENDAGAVVGTLSSFDPDDGDSVTYTVSDDRFEVVDGQVRLVDGVSLDHEEVASIELTVTATDSGGLSTEETFTIDVLDVNEGPSDLALDGSSVSENDAGAVIGTLSSFDPDDGDSVTYTVSDDRFEVVDGQVRLVDGVSLDHEDAAFIELTVTATDSGGLSTEETFTIDVLDVNEGPSDLSLDGSSVSENDTGAVIGTLSSFDPDDGDSVTYTVSDDRFEIVDGQVRLVDGVSLDHEEAGSIDLTVTATDSGGLSTEETFTIDVLDVNEGPSDLTLDNTTVAENDAGAVIGTLSSFDPDDGDSVNYTVSDDRFEVVDGVVRLVDGVSLDHEEAASIELTVTATDSSGLSTEETFTIDVLDVNEGPSDLTLDNATLAENDPGAVIGTLSSFDPDAGDTITYTVSDDRFEVIDGQVRLVDGVSLDHEAAASIDLTVTATDRGGLSTDETFTIDVIDVNEGPSDLTLDNTTVAENDPGAVVGTLSSFDPDAGDTVTYTVSDDRFEVVDGVVRLADGVSLDHEQIEAIDISITATDADGASITEDFTISVADVNEAPFDLTLNRETGIAEADFSANDGHTGDSVERLGLETDGIVFTMSFTTSGDVSTTQTLFETGGSVYGTNVVIEDGMLLIYAGEGNDVELSIPIDGDTNYSFALELDTTNNTIRVLLSDELPLDQMTAENSLVATLTDWTDRDYTGSNQMGVGRVGGGSSQGRIGGEFLGEIDEPGLQVFSDSALEDVFTEIGIAENTEGAVVGTLTVSDPDAGDTITYTVSDDRFEIVDGVLQLAQGVTLDYEQASTIDVTVTATDSGGLTTNETFTVNVIDLNEAPTDLQAENTTVDENTAEGIIGTIAVSDPDAGDTHTFRLVDGDDGPFAVDPETGEISIVTPGMPDDSVLRIDASDVDSLTLDTGVSAIQDLSEQGNTIRQTDADERPDLTNDGPFGGPGLQFDGVNDRLDISDDRSLNLSSQSERSFALTIRTGEDVDSRQVIFEEGGTVNGFNFYIDDGQLYMGAWSDSNGWSFEAITIDIEPGESYSIVTVFDGASNTYTAYVNGEQVGAVEVGDAMSAHSGNIGLGGIAQHTVFHDGASSANDGFYFEGSIGEFAMYNDALSNSEAAGIDMDFRGIEPVIDFETRDSYDLTVEVTDAAGETYQDVITINVNDLNEGPSELALDGSSASENDAGAVVGTLSSFDPDVGDSVTYTVSDDRFEVVDGVVQLVDGVSLDHEEAASIELTVTATDSGGLSTEETFTIDVLDVNEGPSDLTLDNPTVAENDSGAVIGTLSSFDPDAGDTITYTVSDDRFEVVDGVVRLVDGVSLDHEAAASIDLTVTATDSGGLSTEETFTIDVLDVNEGPSDLALDGSSVSENDAGAVVGTLSSFDPDDGDSVTYMVSDDRFEVVDGQVRLVDGVSLDHEDAASIELTVTATDSGGLSTEETFAIDVIDVNEGPSDLSLDGSTVSENDAGAVIGTLSSFDPDDGDSVTYTVSDDRFEVIDGQVRLVDGVSLDHEEAASIGLTITATDSNGLSTEDALTIDVLDVNEGPGDLTLDNTSVAENDAGAVVGTLSSFDPDAGDTILYTVSDDRFEVVDGQVRLVDGVSLDHEEAASIELTITATDSGGLSTEETFTIDVTDINEAPSDIVLTPYAGALSLNQDGGHDDNAIAANMTDFPTDAITVEITFTADGMPAGSGAPLFSYSAGGNWGNDVLLWAESSTGRLSVFLDGQKFQTDIANADLFDGDEHTVSFTWDQDTGELIVYVDGEAEYSQFVNVSELPSDGTVVLGQEQDREGGGYDENQIFEGEISDVRIYDEALSDDAIAGNASGQISADGLVTHWQMEGAENGVIQDQVGDNDLILENDARITNTADAGSPSVAENVEGAIIGLVSSMDPDAGDTVSYTVSDDRFEVVDGVLRLADGVSLDHEQAASIELTVTATDGADLSSSETFTIAVLDQNEAPIDLTITAASDNLVTGGSFEEQDVRTGGWRGFGSDTSGNWDSANGIEVWDNLGGVAASEGNQFLELDYTHAADAISQTVSTEAGQTYILSFDMRARGSSTTDMIEVYWNGELVGSVDPASTRWEEVSFEVTGTGMGDVLEFREADGESDSLGAHLDNIALVEVPMTLVENDAGAVVGTVSVYDPDAGDQVIYTVSDDRFEIVDGVLQLKAGVSLDYEAEAAVELTVTATDEAGLETSETITIDVLDLAEDVALADGGDTYVESGKTESSVTGGDGDDVITGGPGDDVLRGGDGNDLFIYAENGGSDTIDGGAGWTDTLDLTAALGEDAVYGEDWTITVTDGEIVSEDAVSIELSEDASGYITLGNGETIEFANLEQVGF